MKFHKGFLLHSNFKDIAFEVLEVLDETDHDTLLKVFTWNRGWSGKPFMVPRVGQPSRVSIKKSEYSNWYYVDSLKRYAK